MLRQFLLFCIVGYFSFQGYSQDRSNYHINSKLNLPSKMEGHKDYDNPYSFENKKDQKLAFQDTSITTSTNEYIEKMDQYMVLQLNWINDNERFSVNTPTNDFEIFPNGSSNLNFHFNYRFLSFGINYIPKFITNNDDNNLKGETKGFGFGTSLNFTNWIQSFSYSNTRGYYLENSSDYIRDWTDGDPYIQFPKLLYRNFQGSTAYNFNPNFSTKSLLTGTERQVKSAGSFIPMILYRYYLVDDREELTNNSTSQKTNNFEILASAGYYYNYIPIENFYISAGGSLGYGLLHTKLTIRSVDDRLVTKQNNGIFRYEFRAGAGYNADRFYTGFTFTTENSSYKQENTTAINANWRVFTQVMVGYRFNAPQRLRDNLNKIWPQ